MTEKEIESELKNLSAKFAALKLVAAKRPELVQFLDFNEKNLRHVLENVRPTKAILRTASSELRAWVRALFRGDEKIAALAKLDALDEREEMQN
jgi:ABC-type transporter Mla subunit MlaD